MNVSKVILTTLVAACMVQTVQAVPAYPHPKRVLQADGSYVTIVMRGDEHGHIALTTDGHPLFHNTATGNYEYATIANGNVTGSGIVATDAAMRTTVAQTFLKAQDKDAIMVTFKAAHTKAAQFRRARQQRRIRINDYPTMGEQHPLVVLVEFNDLEFTTVGNDAHSFYERMMNEEGFTYTNGANGSVRDYYTASSTGQFTPVFDVKGPVKLSKSYSYYGANTSGEDNYDRIAEMVKEACTMLDDSVDFSKYDTNNDGFVDNIYFIYAGYGEADSYDTKTIWPHSAILEDFGAVFSLDGVSINSYGCGNEIDGLRRGVTTGIGTFVHEFAHILGLGDHYDIYYGSATFTPGTWDVMDQGSYNNNSNTPPLFSAYERSELEWLTYTELNANADSISILPELNGNNMAYRIGVDGTNGREFFVLENRQQHGWDEYLPGHGMLMWHIDIDTLAWENNTINSVSTHQRVDIVEADNKRTNTSLTGDPFPGTANVTKWDMKSWAGDTILSLDDIEEEDENIYIVLKGSDISIATPQLEIYDISDSSFNARWNSVDIANKYEISVYEVDGDTKTLLPDYTGIICSADDILHVEGLQPSTQYDITLVAKRGSFASDTVSASVTTQVPPFTKRYATKVSATDINDSGFTANWTAIEDAESYIVSLYKHYYAEEADSCGYDFSNRSQGMPNKWSVEGGVYVSFNGSYGKSSPSIRLASSGGHITIAYPDTLLSSLSFWGKGGTQTDGYVYVESCIDGEWSTLDSFIPTGDEATAQVRNYKFALADSVRIRLDENNGVFYIDDIVVGCHAKKGAAMPEYTNKEVGNTLSYTFTGLDKGASYGFVVRAKKGETLSRNSTELVVITSTEANGINSIVYDSQRSNYSGKCNSYDGIYDIYGRKQPINSTLSKGIYILKQGNKSQKIMKR